MIPGEGKKRGREIKNKRWFYPGDRHYSCPTHGFKQAHPLDDAAPPIHTTTTTITTTTKKKKLEHQWKKCGTDWRRHEQIFNGISAEGTRGRTLLLLSVVQMGLMSLELQALLVTGVLISCENWFASFGGSCTCLGEQDKGQENWDRATVKERGPPTSQRGGYPGQAEENSIKKKIG